MKIKICGITRLEDALLSSKLGAWAVGFIFYKASLRYIEPQKAADIIKNIPAHVEKTGVFVNSSVEEITNVCVKTRITGIQLHGNETAEFCSELLKLNIPLIKAIRVKNEEDLSIIPDYRGIVSAILLDTYSNKEYGGTGERFNWDIALKAKDYGVPVILAGGLNISNIKDAAKLEVYALDVSSGVEISRGIKDSQKLTELFLLV